MSLFKFKDTNYLNISNFPDIAATVDTYNGFQFKVSDDTAVAHTDATDVKLGDAYVMCNIIDKPEILNTSDYKVVSGEFIRGFRLKDLVGMRLDMSSDLVTDTYSGVAVGNYLVGRSSADTTNTMKWKKVTDLTGYEVYLVVTAKTMFGAFTVDDAAGTVPGGYEVLVVSTN